MRGSCRSIACVASLGALHLGACYQGLEIHGNGPSAGSTTGTDDDDALPSDGTSSSGGSQPDDLCEQRTADPLRRLTHSQYVRSIERLTGVPVPDRLQDLLLPVAAPHGGFDNAADGLLLRQSDADAYQRIAEFVARFAFDQESTDAKPLVTCEPEEDACLTEFVETFGALAYRRPLTPAERDRILAVANDTEGPAALGPWARYAAVLEVTLQSPNFLFVVELGQPTEVDDVVRLEPREMATRLALALWDEAPDRALLDRAEAGELDDAASLREAVRDMLADPRAHQGLRRFGETWFELETVRGAPFASATEATAARLRSDAMAELAALLDQHLVRGDLRDLYTSPETWVTPTLANLYGLEVPVETDATGQGGLVHVRLDPQTRRGGLLGTAAFLATHASGEHPSVVRRGAYVRRVALCTEPPPPPPDVEMGDADADMEDHSADPQCWACHQYLDPIGWGLDRYAADGSLRTLLPSGDPVREDGYLVEVEGSEFSDAPSLGTVLVSTDDFARCAAEKTAQWVLAKPVHEVEACFIDDLALDLADDRFHVPSLVGRIAASSAFQFRVIPRGDE